MLKILYRLITYPLCTFDVMLKPLQRSLFIINIGFIDFSFVFIHVFFTYTVILLTILISIKYIHKQLIMICHYELPSKF